MDQALLPMLEALERWLPETDLLFVADAFADEAFTDRFAKLFKERFTRQAFSGRPSLTGPEMAREILQIAKQAAQQGTD